MILKKNLFLFASIATLSLLNSCKKDEKPDSSEKTITLQPGPNDGNDVYVSWLSDNSSWANSNNSNNENTNRELSAVAWTFNGALSLTRSYISFDLSQIPSDKEIVSAKLSLYGPSSSNVSPQGNAGDNKIIIQQVTDNWNESTLTWNTQPTVSTINQIEVGPVAGAFNIDLNNIDVTLLVKAMRLSPNKTGGFMIKLKDEAISRSLCLTSSESNDPTRRPKLEVVYKN
jgi:hypothetical protein